MKNLFIETTGFTKEVTTRLEDQAYAKFQKRLMENPGCGAVMPGCGGLRKIRLTDPQRSKGKRGGARVIYLHIPEASCILLLDMYDKGEKENLAPSERKLLKRLAEECKAEVLRAASRNEKSKGNE